MGELVWVRATVNLSGLRVGQSVRVDPDVPYIRACLASQVLVPLHDPAPTAKTEEAATR